MRFYATALTHTAFEYDDIHTIHSVGTESIIIQNEYRCQRDVISNFMNKQQHKNSVERDNEINETRHT